MVLIVLNVGNSYQWIHRLLENYAEVQVTDEVSFEAQPIRNSPYKAWAIVFIVAFFLVVIANILAFVYWWKKM